MEVGVNARISRDRDIIQEAELILPQVSSKDKEKLWLGQSWLFYINANKNK